MLPGQDFPGDMFSILDKLSRNRIFPDPFTFIQLPLYLAYLLGLLLLIAEELKYRCYLLVVALLPGLFLSITYESLMFSCAQFCIGIIALNMMQNRSRTRTYLFKALFLLAPLLIYRTIKLPAEFTFLILLATAMLFAFHIAVLRSFCQNSTDDSSTTAQ